MKDLEHRIKELEERVAELEGRVPARHRFVPEDSEHGKVINTEKKDEVS